MTNDQLLTVTDAAAYLRLAPSTLRNWVCQRKIGFIKLGGRVVFRKTDLDAFIASRLVRPGH